MKSQASVVNKVWDENDVKTSPLLNPEPKVGRWKCSGCGAYNMDYIGTCSCGRTKMESRMSSVGSSAEKSKEEQNLEAARQKINELRQQKNPTPVSVGAAIVGGWNCSCGQQDNPGKFCIACGARRPEVQSDITWICACGKKI